MTEIKVSLLGVSQSFCLFKEIKMTDEEMAGKNCCFFL